MSFCTLVGFTDIGATLLEGMNGGDDETRTRDLCRDRLGLLGMVGRILCNGLCNATHLHETY